MKKAVSRILARMAKDGDVEAVAELISELAEPDRGPSAPESAPDPGIAEPAPAAEAPAEPAVQDPSAEILTPGGTQIVLDGDLAAEIVSRLDRLIELLGPSPAPVTDEDPVEEMAEAVAEAVAELTEMPRADPEEAAAETIRTVLAETLAETGEPEPVSGVLEPEEDPEEPEDTAADALRIALKAIRPQLKRMPSAQRQKLCADLAARVKKAAKPSGVYAALAGTRDRAPADPAALGRKIMARRNANFRQD